MKERISLFAIMLKMKRIANLIMVLFCALSLCACGNSNSGTADLQSLCNGVWVIQTKGVVDGENAVAIEVYDFASDGSFNCTYYAITSNPTKEVYAGKYTVNTSKRTISIEYNDRSINGKTFTYQGDSLPSFSISETNKSTEIKHYDSIEAYKEVIGLNPELEAKFSSKIR